MESERRIKGMVEKLIQSVIMAMQDSLDDEQLRMLENVLALNLHGMEIKEECTQLVTSERHWEKILRMYIASKRLENCAESTLIAYKRCITMLFEGINKKIHEITTNDLRYYLAIYQEQRKISLAYLETLRHYISSFFGWATDEGYINRDPTRRLKRVKVPQKIMKPYTAEEREHLKDIAKSERDVALMELMYSTAGRIGEIVSINRNDVDFVNREIIIYGQKGKKERKVYLTEGCMYHLKKYLISRKDDNPALFVGERKTYNRLGVKAIQDMLKKLGKAAGIHAHPHKFRRTLLTDAGARGVPLQEIQAYAGHVKPDTTMLYVVVKQETVKASFMRLLA